jgi:hypothetical protein
VIGLLAAWLNASRDRQIQAYAQGVRANVLFFDRKTREVNACAIAHFNQEGGKPA